MSLSSNPTLSGQQQFFGCSIRNYNAHVGWGDQQSTLQINLAVDPLNGDVWNPQDIGTPAYFRHDRFAFDGLVQQLHQEDSVDGKPVYSVTLVDPREILDGAQIITGNYHGSVEGIPNLYNVFGYWENLAGAPTVHNYGRSQLNEGGMPWEKVRDGITQLADGVTDPGSIYGNTLLFRGYDYKLNLDNLPDVPSGYRIGGENMSILEFISEVCDAAGHEYFVTLLPGVLGDRYISVTTMDRTSAYTPGMINQFITSVNECSGIIRSSEIGLELRNTITCKFVVGGQQRRMYFVDRTNDSADDPNDPTQFYDNSIWQFWGYDANGAPILGVGFNDNHTFTLDSRTVDVVGIGPTYPTNVEEIRAALESQMSWEALLWARDGNVNAPQNGRASAIGLIGAFHKFFHQLANPGPGGLHPNAHLPTTKDQVRRASISALSQSNHEENIKRLYDWIRGIGEEYYGRKYMVTLPFVLVAQEPDTDRIKFSVEPTDGGWLEEGNEISWHVGVGNLPTNWDKLRLQDGRIEPYIKFNNGADLDFSDVNPNDIITWTDIPFNTLNNQAIFVKVKQQENIVFLDPYTQFSPRVVIELPGIVRRRNELDKAKDASGGMLAKFFREGGQFNDDEMNKIFNFIGVDQNRFANEAIVESPDKAVLALQSNVLTYGPWYTMPASWISTSQGGKVEYEYDQSLVPWNYGSYTQMNVAGNAKVNSVASEMQVVEQGSVEVPGTPRINLGSALISGGPHVTDLECRIGEDGITTTYRMQTWTPQFGKLEQQNSERFRRIAKRDQQRRRVFREFLRSPPPASHPYYKNRANALVHRLSSHSSHQILAGHLIVNSGDGNIVPLGNHYLPNCVAQPWYNAMCQLEHDYRQKSVMSMDGMFRPFSTWVGASGIPHYISPSNRLFGCSGSGIIDVSDLNPFRSGHDISILTQGVWDVVVGSGLSPEQSGVAVTDLYVRRNGYLDEVRAMAIRGPEVMSGWSYDINGYPTPNSGYILPNFVMSGDPLASVYLPFSGLITANTYGYVPNSGYPYPSGSRIVAIPSNSFIDGYLTNSDKWSVGPVDMRWDDSRGTYTAWMPPIRGKLDGPLTNQGVATLSVHVFNPAYYPSGVWYDFGRNEQVREVMGVSNTIASGTTCVAMWFEKAGYGVIATEC